jgi:hypothetical protein
LVTFAAEGKSNLPSPAVAGGEKVSFLFVHFSFTMLYNNSLNLAKIQGL